MQEFVHLHVHSDFSLLNGMAQVKSLVKTAKKRGFSALALTDYGSMYGAIKFYQLCKEEGINPILGFEAFVAPRSRFDMDPHQDATPHHLILLAENYEGYKHLLRLTSLGHLEGLFQGVPRIDKELLRQYGGNIIALSGPLQGEIPTLLRQGKYDDAKKVALEYQDIFGKEDFYLELQDHPALSGQVQVNTELIRLSKDTGIPLVVTRDVHYINPDDAEAQDILFCIGKGWKVDYDDREDYRHVDRSFCDGADIASRFRHVKEAVENTMVIANRISIDITLNNWHFAPIDLPVGKKADDVLREQSYACAPAFYPNMGDEVTNRLDYELEIIKKKGYSPYFLCVADYVQYAKDHGIVESTRGSAAGSLVSFVLGITTVDPLRFQLPFERFLNPFRPSPPDIDTDFADDRREEMIEYVTKKYGDHRVAQIITFGTMAARASVRDTGRALGMSYSFCDQVAKLIPPGAQGFPMTIERALNEEPDLKALYQSNSEVKRLLDLARKVEGCARHTSIHAAGVVISPTDMIDFTPVQRETGGSKIVTQYEMKTVEAAGVLKNDFLGIRNLAILGNAVEIVKATTGEDVDIYNLPLDDTRTYDMLTRGETMGLFQLGGSGMTRWLKELKPNRIEDIMAMVALYRPGPMESIPEYIHRKYHPEDVVYLDPRLEKILYASYGLLVYQDDVMLTAIELAGYDWMEADKFRKAMGKKIPEEMQEQKVKFYEGCKKYGNVAQSIIDELWRAIEPFASYGFNKAHAASYGIVAYQTAYMKAHYPVQYMTSVLRAEFGDTDKVAAIVAECRRMGIDVLPPDINESFKNFAMVSQPGEPGRIRFGLSAIKNVGEHICEVIYRERKERGPYTSLENFFERVTDKDLNKKSIESLIMVGAFDCFHHDRGTLLDNSASLLQYSRQLKEKTVTHQVSLFSGTAITVDSKIVLKPGPLATMDQKLVWEKSLLGIYVSSHPFAQYQSAFSGVVTSFDHTEHYARDAWIIVGGVVDAVVKKITKKGTVMLFVAVQDMTGRAELLVFPKTVEKTKELWKEGAVVCVVAKTPKEEGDNKLFVENVYVLTPENASNIARQVSIGKETEKKEEKKKQYTKSLVITLEPADVPLMAPRLTELFIAHPGKYDVYIHIGETKIKAKQQIEYSDTFQDGLKAIIGDKPVFRFTS